MLGRNHRLLKRLRALRRDPALRRAEGVVVAEGLHLVEEALASGADLEFVVSSAPLEQRPGGPELLESLRHRGVPLHETDPPHLDSVQDARSPQPVLALVRWRPLALDGLLGTLPAASLVVVVEGVQHPGNLGSILRSADAAGAAALICGGDGADPSHPRAVRATAGSIFRLPVAVADPVAALGDLRHLGYRAVGSAPGAETRYDRAEWNGPLALALGREGRGLSTELLDAVDERVAIPMRTGVESLSVGAAAAVLLFAAARGRESQRRET
jgi:TrmH family RNA methyltransferase